MYKFLMIFAMAISVAFALPEPAADDLCHLLPDPAPGDGGVCCEQHPVHLLCDVNIAIPKTHSCPSLISPSYMVSCTEFDLSVFHCCDAFCKANITTSAGGHCDVATGACFCEPRGEPQSCPVLTIASGAPGYKEYDDMVTNYCTDRCAQNVAKGCTAVTSVTAGILGTVCMCYCP